MRIAKWVSVALFVLAIQAFEIDLSYRSKGRFREKRDIMYGDLSLPPRSGLFAHMSLGTPAQNFCVVVDTTLDVTVVISSVARSVEWNDKSKYNRWVSTTAGDTGRLVRVRGVRLTAISDEFMLNGIPRIPLSAALLGNNRQPLRLPVAGDGHLGLGYPDITRTDASFNILNVLSEKNLIDYKRFTILCVCANHRNDYEPHAQVVFGAHHKIYPEDFQMVPADISRGTWRFAVLRIGASANEISKVPFFATLDSTTFLNRASVNRARLINTALGATPSGNDYVFDCSNLGQLPTFIMHLHRLDISMVPGQYVQQEENDGRTRCFSTIVSDEGIRNEDMVLGMAFMEHYLTMFDQEAKSLGFQPRLC